MVSGAENPEKFSGENEVCYSSKLISETESPAAAVIELVTCIGSVSERESKKEIGEENEGLGIPNHDHQAHSSAETASEEIELVKDIDSEKEIDEENDGFKTPTRKIPIPTECPPAPRKPHRISRIYVAKSCRRSIRFELETAEVESVFQPVNDDRENEEEPEMKRHHRDDAVLW